MLKRIYIDNFRCLVNFELSVDGINLFLGPNGTGKSALFDVLRKIQSFVSGEGKVNAIFNADDCTCWQTSPIQNALFAVSPPGVANPRLIAKVG